MDAYGIIKKKRDGNPLSTEEIRYMIEGFTKGIIPDYQMAAFLMAVYYNGMTFEETTELTLSIRNSGDIVDLSAIHGMVVDKHSSGGVGDKTTLVVAPIVAACGVPVAKISGRGLGHTGGTIDKLESIPGFCTTLPMQEFVRIVNTIGLSVVGQSGNLAPADKRMYALRDVTATVDSLPLIVSSIMGKKLASGADAIVLDVKAGSGAFMKTAESATRLATEMVRVGQAAGKRMVALITDMDKPLGRNIGNALEVVEAIETLRGRGPADLTELSLALAANMLYVAGKGDISTCEALAADALRTGAALDKFVAMVREQGGNVDYVLDTKRFGQAAYLQDVRCRQSGYITQVDAEAYGMAARCMGAGRLTKEDVIDMQAGIVLHAKTGDTVQAGDLLATLYTNAPHTLPEAERILQQATAIGDTPPTPREIVLARVE